MRVGLQQRVLPAYRVPFFDMLHDSLRLGLDLFAGLPAGWEAMGRAGIPEKARLSEAENLHLGKGRLYACYQRNFQAFLERVQPEVLIVEANPRNLSTTQAVSWMKDRHRPVIGWGLGLPPRRGFWQRMLRKQMLRERMLRSFDALLTYSAQGAEEYRAAGFDAQRIFLAPNAVAPAPRSDLPQRASEFAEGRPRLLFVGRLQARKRLDVLLHALSLFPPETVPHLTIVGDGPEKQQLRTFAASLLPATVFTGELHGEELAAQFRQADLFVLPGTGGLAVQQAMSYGLPVVVGEADGTQSNLVRSTSGWQLHSGTAEELHAILREAVSDAGRLRRMGETGYQIVKNEVNLERMTEGFLRALASVTPAGRTCT